MPVVYNGAHSITFIEALDSDTDSTPTAYSSYKRSWRDFHLVPEKRPSVNPPSPALKLIDIPGTNRRIDMTDLMPGGLKFGRRQGEWQFILDHDLWDNWHVAKKTIEDAINGKRLYCILEDDFNTAYRGRFRVQGWQSGPNYSSIAISYDLEYKKYTNAFNVLDDVTENKMVSSWASVDSMIKDGSYKKNIAIGDSAYLYLPGEYNGLANIVGIDLDRDSSYNAIPITWITKDALKTKVPYDCDKPSNHACFGYPDSGIREYIQSLKNIFPNRLLNMLRWTNKVSYIKVYNSSSDTYFTELEFADYVWIPSMREMFGIGNYRESYGPIYSDIYSTDQSRKKVINGTDTYVEWWLRTIYHSTSSIIPQARTITSGGSSYRESIRNYNDDINQSYSRYITLGFCTGAST